MRPHLTWHKAPHTAGLYADRNPRSWFVGGTVLHLGDRLIRAQISNLRPSQQMPRPYLFITISLPKTVELLPCAKIDFLKRLLEALRLPATAVPWMAWEHGGKGSQHFHCVVLPMTFAGRWIEVATSNSALARVDRELCHWLGLPAPYYFDERRGPRLEVHFPKRRIRSNARQNLASVLNGTLLEDQPRDFRELQQALARRDGGFRVAEIRNNYDVASYEFSGPGLKPILGGELSPELEPRVMRQRFDRARGLRNLRARLELVALTRPFNRTILTTQLNILKEINDVGRDHDTTRAKPLASRPQRGASQTRQDYPDGRDHGGSHGDDPRAPSRPASASGGRSDGPRPSSERIDLDARRDHWRGAKDIEGGRGGASDAGQPDRTDEGRSKSPQLGDHRPTDPHHRIARGPVPGSLGEIISWVRQAAQASATPVQMRVEPVASRIRVRFEDGAEIEVRRDRVTLLRSGLDKVLRAFLPRFAALSGMLRLRFPKEAPMQKGKVLAITRSAYEALRKTHSQNAAVETDQTPPDPAPDPDLGGPSWP